MANPRMTETACRSSSAEREDIEVDTTGRQRTSGMLGVTGAASADRRQRHRDVVAQEVVSVPAEPLAE